MKKLILVTSLLCITSCSTFKSTLGINKISPNEYTVLRNPPLSMPPSDYMLPPAEQSQVIPSGLRTETAEEILYGKNSESNSKDSSLSQSDRKFLANTDHIKKNKDIKEALTQDNSEKMQAKKKSIFSFFKSDHGEEAKTDSKPVKTAPKVIKQTKIIDQASGAN